MNKNSDLSKYNNNNFKSGNILLRFLWYFINIIIFKSSLFPFNSLKLFLLRLFGCSLGKGVVIKPNVNIKYPWKLSLGNYVWIGEQVWIDNLDNVTVGNHVCISQGAILICGSHDYKKPSFDLITKEYATFIIQFFDVKILSYVLFDIIVRFIVQKLKNEHTFLKKSRN